MSEYFANDPECHDLLPCALRSNRVAGLGGCPTGPPVGGVTSTSTPALCGPVALYLLQWPVVEASSVLFQEVTGWLEWCGTISSPYIHNHYKLQVTSCAPPQFNSTRPHLSYILAAALRITVVPLGTKLTGSSGLRSTETEHLWQKYFGGLAVVGAWTAASAISISPHPRP